MATIRISNPKTAIPPWAWPAGVYAALLALHAPLLRLPYFWDEAGYFIFAALDCFRHGWLIPRSTLANGHPPLLSLYLAAAWHAAGFHPWVTRAAMLAWAAALVCGVYRLARARMDREAWIPALLVALTPLAFAQSTLAQLDLPVAALVVWALVELDRPWRCALLLTAACLMKETAVIAPLALLAVAAGGWLAERKRVARPSRAGIRAKQCLALLVPVAALAGWYLYYHHHVGYWFGNPQYFAYNVAEARSLPRILLALLRRCWQLAVYDGAWAVTLAALGGWWYGRRRARPNETAAATAPTRMPAAWLAVIAAYLLLHALVGGAVLARYLLPGLAIYYAWLGGFIVRLPGARWWVAACAALLVAGWFWNPPYPFPYEDNLAYVTFVRLHQAAASQLERDPGRAPIYTAWPATDELTRPALGYVSRPLAVRPLADFSAASLAAARPPIRRLFLYSRTYQPRLDLAARLPFWARWARRYFGYAPPAAPADWLRRFNLRPDFTRQRAGQWVMVASPSAP